MLAPEIAPLKPASSEGLMLIGGGRNARNLICVFETAGIKVRGVVDDQPAGIVLGHDVDFIDSIDGTHMDAFLTVADPDQASALRERPALRGCRWPRFAHPSSVVSSHAEIGEGSYIGPFSVLTDVVIGRHVHLFTHNVLGARVEVGDFTVILPHATIASDARIGKRCMIAMGARIRSGVTIGDDCRIDANAVVRRDMPNGSIAVCNNLTRTRQRIGFDRSNMKND
ncbi:UDP-3-O-[3-hydroxymyristoyl] glucosamine N-acyltransferase [Agrobacterium vitis]|nr:UDP-3-O-[3-hydroxymyristoyl] glucosamine N-acyltransferase [Agrobacterium vitis]MBE1438839.1 UDP-3-O-[3-hydroxymyristoyl] glucosamine N-acyltransferase [Agrobacterium vitis]